MDISTLTTFLAPALPYLTKLGDKAAESAAEKLGEATWTKATSIWNKLHPKAEAKPATQEAIADLIQNPDDLDLQAVFRVQLKKILEQDDELCQAITQIMEGNNLTPTTQINQTVTGNRNQIIGQSFGSTVVNVSGGSVTIDSQNSPPQPKAESAQIKTILVLSANPKGTNPLRLGEEVSSIQKGLERSKDRDRFQIEQRWAVTTKDVRRALLDIQPEFVHFCGHGEGVESSDSSEPDSRDIGGDTNDRSSKEGLIFEDKTGTPHWVSTDAIATLFSLFSDSVECVVLNACYSATQANAIAEHIPHVVGMKRAIGDRAAIEFAIGFYDALLAGRDVDFAFNLGRSSIQMEGITEHLTPVFIEGKAAQQTPNAKIQGVSNISTTSKTTSVSGNKLIGKKQSILVTQQNAQVDNNWIEGEEQNIAVNEP